ncbi:Vps68p [Sugiyamaella lignohabitans]|uniref:Vps68p n=1 Tax=Sugiyamaella lignohabitans TaxID=796027 RepID=A0A167DPB8_9ASCO|nr:Vps68p [Sugiyamaella lignohabitans]ANB13133.1 Vps68p [Sugiyamaella lignohabitans]
MSERLFRFYLPRISSTTLRAGGVYLAGALYSAGFYAMLDSALFSSHGNASTVHVKFADWLPFILSSLGMLVINTVEKSRLTSESFSFGSSDGYSSSADWQAKVILFLGFALLAGGLSGSVVVLILRYVVPNYPMPTIGMGISNVVSNAAVTLSCISLWLAQNLEDEYSYSLQL